MLLKNKNTKPGMVIILNGPSSSGKSSIQKALEEIADRPILHLGIDNGFIGVLPVNVFSDFSNDDFKYAMNGLLKHDKEMFFVVKKNIMTARAYNDGQHSIYSINFGDEGKKVIFGLHEAIKGYAKAGNDITVDYIQYEKGWLNKLKQTLIDVPTYIFGVTLPLEILELREKERGTSPVGHARSHYFTVHNGISYDLMLDTSKLSSEQCAEQILQFIKANPR